MNKQQLINELAPFRNRWQMVTNSQSVGDIMTLVLSSHRSEAKSYDKIAPYFSQGNILKNIFRFCKDQLPYNIESEAAQSARSPGGILNTADSIGVDCKHYAQFIGGILSALNRAGYNFNWCYRFACYDGSRSPDHVYIVVKENGSEINLDPTPIQTVFGFKPRSFNDTQLSPSYFIDKKVNDMALYKVSGAEQSNKVGSLAVDAVKTTITQVASFLPSGAFKDFLTGLAKDPVGYITTLLTGRTYTSGDYRLGEIYMRSILGMATIQTRGAVPDEYVPQSWLFWTVALGTRIRSADHLDKLAISPDAYTSYVGANRTGATAEQIQRAYNIIKSFGYPECEGDYRRNIPWELKKFAAVPYIGRLPNYIEDTWFTGTHPITGIQYNNGYQAGSSGLTQPYDSTANKVEEIIGYDAAGNPIYKAKVSYMPWVIGLGLLGAAGYMFLKPSPKHRL